MQTLPDSIVGYLLLNLLPMFIMMIMVIVIWQRLWELYSKIHTGYRRCSGQPSVGQEEWAQVYNSYLQEPKKWNMKFKGITLLSFILAGLAVGWVRPFEVYWPPFLVFSLFGIVSALYINLPR
ncbi:MAG: hypothetical protein EAX95_15700 [Candidatus Thorarchaeota archaeon]|nr:hypothetical protein [Candidatus Thorarchaeota archaeon]